MTFEPQDKAKKVLVHEILLIFLFSSSELAKQNACAASLELLSESCADKNSPTFSANFSQNGHP